ncbi:MAG TPA: hypothetical protein VGR22_08070, partial [Thermomicrobiales bacterium]|nr:hypothetical protein [Thermomicrobiales bacterium]
ELPLTSLQYGGCFCKDCMKGFRAYLQALPIEALPDALRGADLASFHYGEWLRLQRDEIRGLDGDTPLFEQYLRFQRQAVARYFGELADYVHEYGASKGREVAVSGNLFNLFDHFHAVESKVDLIITEMRNTRYRQPGWYRYVAGFAGPKPTVVVENPYGGVVPELVEKLNRGEGYNLFRLSLYEAAAMGVNMSVPYGAWLGSSAQDAFYAPHDLSVEIQQFLANHQHLYSRETCNEVAVVYSVECNFLESARMNFFADNRQGVPRGEALPFWQVCETLADTAQPFDVVFFPDTRLRPDELTLEDLRQYRTIVLPDCRSLTAAQYELIRDFLADGCCIVVIGDFGLNLPDAVRHGVLGHERTTLVRRVDGMSVEHLSSGPQVRVVEPAALGVNLQRVAEGVAVHIVRYDFDERQDRIPDLATLTMELRLPGQWRVYGAYGTGGTIAASLSTAGEMHRLELENVPLYGIVSLREARI